MLKGKMLNLTKILPIPLILIILAFAPYFLRTYHLLILRDVLIWTALAISWDFFSGLTKYISLGSAAFFGTGLYFTARYLNLLDPIHPILPLPVVVLLAGLVIFASALAIGSITLRLKGIYFAIVTFGISQVFQGIIKWLEISRRVVTIILPPFDPQTAYYSILIAMLAVLLLTTFLRRSKFGLALRMIGECEDAAAHVGVNTGLYKTLGFAISAMCIGFMGACFATYFPSTTADIAFDPNYSFKPAIMAMLGGVGTVYGCIIGSTTLTLIYDYLLVTFTSYFLIILGVILIIIILIMPNGIMGVIGKVKSKLFGREKSAKGLKTPS